ncbi:MAG: hypothetical protein ABH869_01835 [Candidatus Omnitrophota bacterium]
MKSQLNDKELKLLKNILKTFNIAIKSCVLYAKEHPLFIEPIKIFKKTLDEWFFSREDLELGVSPSDIFFKEEKIEETHGMIKELAEYLHSKDIVFISIKKGISVDELALFFGVLKNDAKVMRAKGGIVKNLKEAVHIYVEEIDYSSLLQSGGGEEIKEEDAWQSLFAIAKDAQKGKLPESKDEFITEFLQNPGEAGKMLNMVYKRAVSKLKGDEAEKDIHETIARICLYLGGKDKGQSEELKEKLMTTIGRLQPDLMIRLFERADIDGKKFDLADEVTKDLSDTFIADFMESFISGEGGLNNNLLKVFDKLAPDAGRANTVATMISDKLFDKKLLNSENLSGLQNSIKELFSKNSKSDFMLEMYKITVDACVNRKIDRLVYRAKLAPLISKYVQSAKEEGMKKDEIRLLLNIISLEKNAGEFEKYTERILKLFPEIHGSGNMDVLKEAVEFFNEKLDAEQKKNEKIKNLSEKVLADFCGNDVIDEILKLLPEADSKTLKNIGYILSVNKANTVGAVIDLYLYEQDQMLRGKLRSILSSFQEEAVAEIFKRLEQSGDFIQKELFALLKEYAPLKAHSIAVRLISYKDPEMRLQGLKDYEPQTRKEQDGIFAIYKKEKEIKVKHQIMEILLKTRDKEVIDKIFKNERKWFKGKAETLKLVELCGYLKIQESFSQLKRIFLKSSLFNDPQRDKLRVTAASGLRRLHTDEAMALIKKGLKDKNERVRKMCEIIIELDKKEHMDHETGKNHDK